MLKTDPPEVSVPFYSKCISEDLELDVVAKMGVTHVYREMVVPRLSIVVL